ncbi:hypothetical protein [Hippea alviniae]|uniref:hypothetical protein n=1 Tax=Hippea alviniae TaxID=1279027 RepID=UPI0003B60835|nr:hypothetical protein [Hippea alviniae]
MKRLSVFVGVVIFLMFAFMSSSFAYQKTLGLTDREIVEKLTKLEEGQKALQKEMEIRFNDINKRFDDVNKRFDDINRRFGDINRRFDDVNRRFDDLNRSVNKRFDDMNNRLNTISNLIVGAMGVFAVLIATVIGLVFWDRKSLIDASVRKVETDSRLIKALQELSKEDAKVAKVLKMFGLL